MKRSRIHFVGLSLRFPGACSVNAFERMLFGGHCAISQIPGRRWNQDLFLHEKPGVLGRTYSFAAGAVDGIYDFDPKVFGISPREAEYMDPQQRMLLQVVWEALEDACLVPSELSGKNVGVFVGASTADYGNVIANDPGATDGYMMTGNSLAVISNRVSHVFDWHGPSMTIDTACSSSLYALEAASKALETDQIDIAIVGATNALLYPLNFVGFSAARMLSPTGISRPFSAEADGYVRAEGAGAVVLRRVADSDRPARSYGTLIGIGVNTSGQSINIAVPSFKAQVDLLEATYDRLGISPDALAFIEAHGTGTRVGDPIEAEALGRALGTKRTSPLPIGSVKSNIGHLEPAAGIAGIIKSLIALNQRKLPPTLHAEQLNPDIDFDKLGLDVARQVRDLAPVAPLLAGVSSFGFGGANAHAVIAGPDNDTAPASPAHRAGQNGSDPRGLLFVSTFCEESLREAAGAYGERLVDRDAAEQDQLAAELLFYRDTNPHRLAVVASAPKAAKEALLAYSRGETHAALASAQTSLRDADAVFTFSGNGPQYAGMSRVAYADDRTFRDAYDEIDQNWREISGWSLVEMMQAEDLAERLPQGVVSQPLLFADQVAMARSLMEKGLAPAAVLGHSGGEMAAAHISGALDVRTALRLIDARATWQEQVAGRGTMSALLASQEEARAELADPEWDGIDIAAVNSARSVTLASPAELLERFARAVRRKNRWACVKLSVNYPFHSSMLADLEVPFRDAVAFIKPAPTDVPFISSVTGRVEEGEHLDADYWWHNVRDMVNFQGALAAAADLGFRAFIEIGPDPVLTSYIRDSFASVPGDTAIAFASRKTDSADVHPALMAMARALVHGLKIDREKITPKPERASGLLAPYPFQARKFNVGDNERIQQIVGLGPDFHKLLGVEIRSESRIWHNEIDASLQSVFADHSITGKPVLPGTALAEMALAAAQRTIGGSQVELRDLDLSTMVHLLPSTILELQTQAANRERRVRISSRQWLSRGPWRQHAEARFDRIVEAPPPETAPVDLAVLPGDGDGAHIYRRLAKIGLTYGPAFHRLDHYRITDENTVEVVLSQDFPVGYNPADWALDPVAADGVFHGLAALFEHGPFADLGLAFVPIRIGRLSLLKSGTTLASARLRVASRGQRSIVADVVFFDANGAPVARIQALRLQAVELLSQVDLRRQVFGIDLIPIDPAATGPTLDLPAPEAVTQRATKLVGDGDAQHEVVALLNAAALSISFRALAASGLVDAGGRIDPTTLPPQTAGWLAAVARPLENAELAAREPDGTLVLDFDRDLPLADDLIAGIAFEWPELGPELAMLARLQTALPDLLGQRLDWSLEGVYGRAALENVTGGSALGAGRRAWLNEVLANTVEALPDHRPVRIAEVAHGMASVLADIANTHIDANHELIVIPTSPADMRPTVEELDGKIEVVPFDELAQAQPFDLIVCSGSDLGRLLNAATLAQLAGHLVPGGRLISAEQSSQVYLEMLTAVSQSNEGLTEARFHSAATLRDDAARCAAGDVAALDLAGVANGIALLALATGETDLDEDAGSSDTSDAPVPVEPVEVRPTVVRAALATLLEGATPEASTEITVTIHDELQITILERTGTAPDPVAPPVLFAPDLGDGPQAEDVLKKRMLHLGRVLSNLPIELQTVWIILPNGAGYRGAAAQSPSQAALWAWLRVAKNEFPHLDLKAFDPGSADPAQAAAAFADLLGCATDETELVLHAERLCALRVRQGAAAPGWTPKAEQDRPMRAVLRGSAAGGLDDLSWRRAPLATCGPTEVTIAVDATGLNYRDVMWSLGLLPEEALEDGFAGATLGIECAGRVVETGRDVSDLAAGDLVVAFGTDSLASHVTVDRKWVGQFPAPISAEAAATAPVTFFSAFVGLVDLARLAKGETVLIHGGAGGVGLAAIQIAQRAGATVIATAGSPVKRALLKSLGVDHMLDSRSLTFVSDVERLTGGRGVDVVLNSLSGEAMEHSIGLLRPFGRFVELGKYDFYANTSIGLRALKDNVSYFALDVDQLLARQPGRARKIFADMLALFAEGEFAPLLHRSFAGRDVVKAFRTMQRSDHVGKIVVRPPAVDTVTQPDGTLLQRPKSGGLAVLVGGAGGLGLALADRMSIEGAEAIALLGRSPEPSPEAQVLIDRITARGTELKYITCDVTDRMDLDAALDALRSWRKITDVYHTAMVLDDRRIPDIDRDTLDLTMPVKTRGVSNLDAATRVDKPRNFVVFSSLASLIGNHGQAAYVAANGWLEAVVRRRRAAGFAAHAIGWGAIDDVGYLTRDAAVADYTRRFGGNVGFNSSQALQALDRLLAEHQTHSDDDVLWISPMSWTTAVKGLRLLTGPSYATLWKIGQSADNDDDTDDLREALIALTKEKAVERLVGFLVAEVARILRVPQTTVDPEVAIVDLGIDSLMTVELGLAAQQTLGDEVSLVAMSDNLTLTEIAARMVTHLRGEVADPVGAEMLPVSPTKAPPGTGDAETAQ